MATILMLVSSLIPSMALSAFDVGLTKIDRTIAKEPPYKSKNVKFCLLVFGPEAKTRVWLVQDADTLYVDRNANGDLTETGEAISATPGPDTDSEDGTYLFECEEIQDGRLTHQKLRLQVYKRPPAVDELEKLHVAKNPSVRFYSVKIDVQMPGYVGDGLRGRVEYGLAHRDRNGFLEFTGEPTTAPVIHLGGPWQVLLFPNEALKIGSESDVALVFGTQWIALVTQVMPKTRGNVELTPDEVAQPRIHLIDAVEGKLRETLIAPPSFVSSICFSPDGKTLATSGEGKVLLWDVSNLSTPGG